MKRTSIYSRQAYVVPETADLRLLEAESLFAASPEGDLPDMDVNDLIIEF